VLVVGLDTYVLITALPTLSSKLGASTSQLQWITTAYNLAWAGLLLPLGKLGDRIGLRRIVLIGLVVFGVASVAASQAQTANQLIAMRAVMGAGAAIILPIVLAILPVMFPDASERRRAVAITTIGITLGLPVGPLLAGWMLNHFYWGSVFLINGPVVLVSLIGVALWVPESKDPSAPKLDWPGAFLAAVGVTALVYGIIEQPTYGWDTRVLAALGGGLLALVVFVFWQMRARSPLADLRLFRNRTFTWGTLAFAVISFAMAGVLFVLSPYLQLVQGNDAQGTGLRLLPMIGAMLVAAGLSDVFAAKLGVKIVISAGMVIGGVGLFLLSQVTADSGYGPVALALAVLGVGLGLGLPLAADAVLDALPKNQTGMGNSLSRTLQQVGSSTGAAILGSVLNGGYRSEVSSAVAGLPDQARTAARSSVAGAHAVAAKLPGDMQGLLLRAANRAYSYGMSHALWVNAGVMVVSAVIVLIFLPQHTVKPEPEVPVDADEEAAAWTGVTP
jgi:EmrB/QacA subfamily drug resistance transporter